MNTPLQIIGWRDEQLVLWSAQGELLMPLEKLVPYLLEKNIAHFQCAGVLYQTEQIDAVPLYQDLEQLPYLPQALLSRWLFAQSNGTTFDALSEGEAAALFKQLAPNKKHDSALTKTLLQGVHFGAPAVALLARAYKHHPSIDNVGEFVEWLQKHTPEGAPAADLPILQLFQASSFAEEETFVLGTLALLPALPISGEMYGYIVGDSLPAYAEILPALVQKGWLASADLEQFQLYAPLRKWILALCPPRVDMRKRLADVWLKMLREDLAKDEGAIDALLVVTIQGFLEKFDDASLLEERAQLWETLNVAYQQLGKPLLGANCLTAAMQLLADSVGKMHLDYTNFANNLAVLYAELGQFDKAISLGEEVRQLRAQIVGEKHVFYLNALQNLGYFYRDAGKMEQATPLLEAAQRLSAELLNLQNNTEVQQKAQQVLAYMEAGKFEEALPIHQEILAKAREDIGEQHPEYITMLSYLAYLYEQVGKPENALEVWQDIVRTQARLGESHPDYLSAVNNVAVWHIEHGNFAEAKPLLDLVLQKRGQAIGELHPDYAVSLHNLGTWHRQQNQPAEAKPYFERAYNILRDALGEKNPHTQTAKDCLEEASRF